MSIIKKTALLLVFSGSTALAGNGTLPLGNGTLPLKLGGHANLLEGGGNKTIPTAVSFLNQQTVQNNQANFRCSQRGTKKYTAPRGVMGDMKVGNTSYQIVGICHQNVQNRQQVEIIARAGRSQATLNGVLTAQQKNQLQLNGRLLNGKRYNVSLKGSTR